MNEIKSAFEKIEINEELKNRSLENLLDRSRSAKGERTMKRTFRMKKTAAMAAAAAAALAMAVTAGAVISGTFHKETVDTFLGSGAADELSKIQETEGKVITTANSVENGYFRITVDAVLSDGDRAVIYVTKERLTDDRFGLEIKDGTVEMDWVTVDTKEEDGSLIRDCETSSRWKKDDPASDNFRVVYERYFVNGIDPNKKLSLKYYTPRAFLDMMDELDKDARQAVYDREDYEEYRDSYYYPYYLQGLELTVDVSNNFNAEEFTDAKGRTVSVTPYSIYVSDKGLYERMSGSLLPFEIKAVSADGVQTVSVRDINDDYDTLAQEMRGMYFNLAELIKEPEKIKSIEIAGIGTFTR